MANTKVNREAQTRAELGIDLQRTGLDLYVVGRALAEGSRLDAHVIAKGLREANDMARRAGVPVAA